MQAILAQTLEKGRVTMKSCLKNLICDIAPLEGRKELNRSQLNHEKSGLTWAGSFCSIAGEYSDIPNIGDPSLRLQGTIYPRPESNSYSGWIELETLPGQPWPIPAELYPVGTRPLPRANITCISRHPLNQDYLVAATSDCVLLLLDARLQENLKVLSEIKLATPIISLVCCGKYLLGLTAQQTLEIIETGTSPEAFSGKLPAARISVPAPLIALAENDLYSAWGLTGSGKVYGLQLRHSPLSPQTRKTGPISVKPNCRLKCPRLDAPPYYRFAYDVLTACSSWSERLARFITCFTGLAFDGQHFWAIVQPDLRQTSRLLLLYSQNGTLVHSFILPPEVAVSAINYRHNNLLVLDLEHQQLHTLYPADFMQPQSSLALSPRHPGYLNPGTGSTAGIHDLCLLYVGDEGNHKIHRYDLDKLLPLVGYIDLAGNIKDFFMDGFLMLAQYSPLLNGRAFAVDLPGSPALKEDWLALFDEYFEAQSNLQALDECVAQISRSLDKPNPNPVKVVLSIPTPDPRCNNWDNAGFSLAGEANRIEVTRWAAAELINRWRRANFQHLELAGFYYMTEQGLYGDPVQHMFPALCHQLGVRSFAIPGLFSSSMTEFVRAGFDCVTLQSSHAFWHSKHYPWYYLLKNAGRIARDFGMGMEVELPYNVLEPAGRQKLRDYLDMAVIQGWAGAFKAYFQSFNLIKTLAESQIAECRQLYDDLYFLSRLSRQPRPAFLHIAGAAIPFDGRIKWPREGEPVFLRLNIEGWQGILQMKDITSE